MLFPYIGIITTNIGSLFSELNQLLNSSFKKMLALKKGGTSQSHNDAPNQLLLVKPVNPFDSVGGWIFKKDKLLVLIND